MVIFGMFHLMTCSLSCTKIASFSTQALSTDSIERLPVFNKSALRHYKLNLEADDWCVPSKEPLDLARYRAQK